MKNKRFNNEEISSFCLELSLLLHAGISTEDGLYLLADDATDAKEKKVYTQMAESLSDGKTMAETIREVKCFPAYMENMVETGEQTGRLEQSFQALSEYYDRQMHLTDQVKSALLYPIILLVLMVVIIAVLLVKVLPIFNQVYEQLGGTMMGTAKVLLQFGDALGGALPVLGGIVAVFALFAICIVVNGAARDYFLKKYNNIFGNRGLTRKIGEARFASSMAMGMMSGLNMEDAFRMAMVFHTNHKKVQTRQEKCLEMLEKGEQLADSFRVNNILQAKYCRILDLGAKSGTVDTAMGEIARRMEDKVELELHQKVGKIEPTIVVITSVLVGIILIAVLLPLVHIMSSIG